MSNLKDKLTELTTLVKVLETWGEKLAGTEMDLDVLISYGGKVDSRLFFNAKGELELETF